MSGTKASNYPNPFAQDVFDCGNDVSGIIKICYEHNLNWFIEFSNGEVSVNYYNLKGQLLTVTLDSFEIPYVCGLYKDLDTYLIQKRMTLDYNEETNLYKLRS
jgi:uncharacterized protein YqkB